MKLSELAAELAKGRLRPAYLVVGEEPLLRDAALAAIEARALADVTARDFNFDRLDVGSVSPARLEEALGTLPMLARQRLVVVREGDGRSGGFDESWSVVFERVLAATGDAPSAILVVVARKVDRRSRWVKAFSGSAVLVECDAPTGARELEEFLTHEARRLGIDVTADAVDLLCERIGPHLLLLRQELEKLALHVGDGGRIDRAVVALAVSSVAEESIWELTDAIGQGRAADSLATLARIRGQGEASQVVLAALASHFRRLVRVGHGDAVKGPPFVVRKLEQQARRIGPPRLLACLRAIQRADVELKGAGVLRPDRTLEQLVLQLSG